MIQKAISIKVIYLLSFLGLVGLFNGVHAQSLTNLSCYTAKPLCENREYTHDLQGLEDGCMKPIFYYFHSSSATANAINLQGYTSNGYYVLYRFTADGLSSSVCNQLEAGTAEIISSGSVSNSSVSIPFNQVGVYVLRVTFNQCYSNSEELSYNSYYLGLDGFSNISCPEDSSTPELECTDCITSFSPTPGKYMVSAWVSEDGASMTTTTYSNTTIGISFSGNATTYTLIPTGQIIDGWQRIESVVEVPSGATDIHLTLQTASGASYFDDVRFSPLDGKMLSYVYDPVNLRLMAQLDERNYATFYEYDEEGKLVRVKKETERGVMTIQENRDNIRKQ